ncbi:hypothetical protein BY996DRAFT_182538 [Phakopsora pachyrhizi]|nr:hypothetical protein BY996DRAFT_182538 [Phakopsora pachyrhizi]
MTISCWYPDHLDNDRLPAYIHLNQQLRPYKQHIPSDSHLNLQLIKTIESLDYVPSNRNLAIKQTISHYYTHHLPNYLLNQLSRWITEPGIRSLRSTGRLILSSRIKRTDPSVDLGSVSMAGCPSNLSFESQKSSSSRFSSELSNRASDSQSGSGFNSLTGNVVILGGVKDLSNGVRPSRMLDRVSLTPFLPPVLDMGYTLRRRLERIDQRRLDGHRYLARNQSGAEKHFEPERLRVFQWGYDFRADLDELGDQLIDYLTELRSRNESHSSVGEEGSGATVLAHSMGQHL